MNNLREDNVKNYVDARLKQDYPSKAAAKVVSYFLRVNIVYVAIIQKQDMVLYTCSLVDVFA